MRVYGLRKKESRCRLILMPTGDIQADIKIIREYYSDIQGEHPTKPHQ